MTALEAIVAAARAGGEEEWEVGPITARDAVRFAAASGDVEAITQLQCGTATAPVLMLSGVLDWGAGSDATALRADGLSPREAPYVGDHDVRLVHGGQALHWYRPVHVCDERLVARRTVVRAEHRVARSGELAIIGLQTRYVAGGVGPVAVCRESILCLPSDGRTHGDRRPTAEIGADAPADVDHAFTPMALARFSAVTWNAHRIHVDEQFARSEGFDGPVVHSTLHGVMVLRAAERASACSGPVAAMSWRNLVPVAAGERLRAAAHDDGRGGWDVVEWAADGVATARGHVRFRSEQWTVGRAGAGLVRHTRRVGFETGEGAR